MAVIICILIGVLAGVLSGLCGVGGGIIMVPAFVTFLKMTQKQAVATSLAAIILTSLAGSLRNSGSNLIDFRVAVISGLAAGILAFIAAGWLKSLSNITLTRVFAILIIVVGFQMLWSSRSASATPAAGTGPATQDTSQGK